LAGRICGRILPKGAKEKFLKVPYFTVMANSQRQRQNLILILNLTLRLKAALMFCEIGRTFSKIGRTFLMYWPKRNFGTWQHWRWTGHVCLVSWKRNTVWIIKVTVLNLYFVRCVMFLSVVQHCIAFILYIVSFVYLVRPT
jgi:hypothetical protein